MAAGFASTHGDQSMEKGENCHVSMDLEASHRGRSHGCNRIDLLGAG
jgi:hypothetical protein